MFKATAIMTTLIAAIALPIGTADAQPQVVVVQDQAFDRIGWLGRFSIGGGYHYSDGNEVDLHGPAILVSAAGGISVTPTLTFHGEAWASLTIGPTAERDIGSEVLDTGTSLTAVGAGPGFTFFLEPMGAFISASVGFSIVQLEVDGILAGESHLGWGSHLMLGKDWWISPHYSVGFALNFMVQMNRDSGGWLNTYAAGISFVGARM